MKRKWWRKMCPPPITLTMEMTRKMNMQKPADIEAPLWILMLNNEPLHADVVVGPSMGTTMKKKNKRKNIPYRRRNQNDKEKSQWMMSWMKKCPLIASVAVTTPFREPYHPVMNPLLRPHVVPRGKVYGAARMSQPSRLVIIIEKATKTLLLLPMMIINKDIILLRMVSKITTGDEDIADVCWIMTLNNEPLRGNDAPKVPGASLEHSRTAWPCLRKSFEEASLGDDWNSCFVCGIYLV
mmetsp:Transcript_6955/g.14528  ORF Transcript_6955/g.14528 Transcript_6955/m.14528 type:complete len:239 (-) Transcript_6955:40-756(-)